MTESASISPEILRQVKRIELRTRGLVNSRFVGEYHSVFKGQGMEFSEVREYQSGDEVRMIDWNVSARMNRLFVKRYVEERELTVLLIVDCSGSSRFGTGERDKQSMAAELAAVLALTATRNNDRVGLILCSDQIEHVVPPRKGRRHALRVQQVARRVVRDRRAGRRRHPRSRRRSGSGEQLGNVADPGCQLRGATRIRRVIDEQLAVFLQHRPAPRGVDADVRRARAEEGIDVGPREAPRPVRIPGVHVQGPAAPLSGRGPKDVVVGEQHPRGRAIGFGEQPLHDAAR